MGNPLRLLLLSLALLVGPAHAQVGSECPANDPDCIVPWLTGLADALDCTDRCGCEKLAKPYDLLVEMTALASEAPTDKECEKALKKASKGAKKLGKGGAKAAKKACAEPLATAAELAEAGSFAGVGLKALAKAHACALRVAAVLEPANAATASIGPDGGSLEATGSDGTHYALEIPPGALLDETEITLTPALATGTPFSGGALAALQLEPSGLTLWVPGTLTVDLTAAPDPADVVGFGWGGSGWNVGLELVQVTGDELVLSVLHFSGLGAALAAPEDLAALLNLPVSSPTQGYQNQALAACLAVDQPNTEDALRRWYDDHLADALADADSDPKLTQALRDFEAWRLALDVLAIQCGFASPPDVGGRLAQAEALAAAALVDGIARADTRCRAFGTVHGAEDELRWQAIAEALGLAGAGSGLELDDVLAGLCLEILYRDTDYAATPMPGVTSPLTVEVEISFPALNSLPQYQPIAVEVDAQGTQEGSASGSTDSNGIYTVPFTPDGSGEVAFTIEACFDEPSFPLVSQHVCQTAILVRGLEVLPATAQIGQGSTQQFSALISGSPYANVSWSADGGSIDANGLYTGTTPGTYTVTATDLANPGSQATATVTVDGGPVGTIGWGRNLCQFNVGVGVLVGNNTFCNGGSPNGGRDGLPYLDEGTAECSRSLPGVGSASAMHGTSIDSDFSRDASSTRNGVHFDISSEGSATLTLETPDDGAYAGGGGLATCLVEFNVVGGFLPYDLVSTLTKTESGGGGGTSGPPYTRLSLVRFGVSPVEVLFEAEDTGGSQQGSLAPGSYQLKLELRADVSFGGGVTGSGSASASGTADLTLGEP